MTQAEQKLAAECFDLAKALKWRREPFDAKQIEALSEHFYRVARTEAGNAPGRIELVLGAIEVLSANLCGPDFDGGEAWFSVALRTLLDVAESCRVRTALSCAPIQKPGSLYLFPSTLIQGIYFRWRMNGMKTKQQPTCQSMVFLLRKLKRFSMIHCMWISTILTIPMGSTVLSCWVNRHKGDCCSFRIWSVTAPSV